MGKEKSSHKLRLLYIVRILLEHTDDEHSLSRNQITAYLSEFGIGAPDRDTFADDIKQLELFGLDIIKEKKGLELYYHIGVRLFETAELKIIVDTVQSSRFLTEKKSRKLINKLEKLTSRYDAEELDRQVYVNGRIKSDNNNIFYNVDRINDAINRKKQISFRYFELKVARKSDEEGIPSLELKKEYRHLEKKYHVSPWTLISNNQNYYMVGCDETGDIKHYRVDRMDKIDILEECSETGSLSSFNVAEYAQKHFEMFNGEERKVTLNFNKDIAFIICDRFGSDINLRVVGDDRLEADVTVCISNQFLAWILSLGNDIYIAGPEDVVEQMKLLLRDRSRLYEGLIT